MKRDEQTETWPAWRPIEMKDGKPVDETLASGEPVLVYRRYPNGGSIRRVAFWFYNSFRNEDYAPLILPTHWMPLPPPPEEVTK